jgi:hypothetical protein
LVVSPSLVIFQKKIISMSTADNPNVIPLKITNLGLRPIYWEIDCDDGDSEESANSFSVSVAKGKLEYREMITVDA